MKIKKLFLLVATVALAYTGTSWYSGQQTKVWYEQSVAIINKHFDQAKAKDFTGVEIVEYQAGIFSATATLEIKQESNLNGASSFRFQERIQHGPIMWNDDGISLVLSSSQGELLKTTDKEVQKLFTRTKDNNPITYSRTLSFNKQSETKVTIAESNLAVDTEQFSGGTLTVTANADFTELFGSGAVENITDKRNDYSQVIIKNLTFNFAKNKIEKNLGFTVGKFSFSSKKLNLELDNIDIKLKETDLDLANGKFSFNFNSKNARLDDYYITDPLLEVNIKRNNDFVDSILRIKADNLLFNDYSSGLVDLTLKTKNIQYQLAKKLGEQKGNQQSSYLSALQLLNYNPSVAIDPLIWKNEKGKSTIVLETNLKNLNVAALSDYSTAIEDTVPYLRVEFDLSRAQIQELTQLLEKDKSPEYIDQFMAKYDQLVDLLSQEKLVVKHENSVSTQWELKSGTVYFNEQTMALKEYLAFIETVGEKIRSLTDSVDKKLTD